MKTKLLALLTVLLLVSPLISATAPLPKTASVSNKITGDYIEARTCSVFAGACHYNGEYMTLGRDAVLAWNFTGGSYEGASLAGVKAMAVVTCDDNLASDNTGRKYELTVDPSASASQVSAVADFIQNRLGSQLGKLTDIRHATISFSHVGTNYDVKSAGFASLTAQSMPNDECCKQPSMVWYTPIMPLTNRKVGYTIKADSSSTIADPWQREGENSAFYGQFSL